jgi:transposase
MKRAHHFAALTRVRYRPEVPACPHCGTTLQYRHEVWAKPIQFLSGPEHVTNLGFGCPHPDCAQSHTIYRSAQAEARQIKGSGYGLDVVVQIGHWRFADHRTREEIWRRLHDETPVQLSERHVQNLLEVYLALLRASEQDLGGRLAPVVEAHGGVILALDGLQPEQGNEQLWMVREVLSGTVLGARNLQQASGSVLAQLLAPIAATGVPVLGVISDAQESIRLAVRTTWPTVPHQWCQYHALREAAAPLWEIDRHLLVQAKQELRGLREVEARTRRAGVASGPPPKLTSASPQPEPDPDPAGAVVLDTVLALRQIVRERGLLPFDFAGLRAGEALSALEQTLDRCLVKKGMRA